MCELKLRSYSESIVDPLVLASSTGRAASANVPWPISNLVGIFSARCCPTGHHLSLLVLQPHVFSLCFLLLLSSCRPTILSSCHLVNLSAYSSPPSKVHAPFHGPRAGVHSRSMAVAMRPLSMIETSITQACPTRPYIL